MSKILADSHILIWLFAADAALPDVARQIIEDRRNIIYYSAASIWEIEIKFLLRKGEVLKSGTELADLCGRSGFYELPIRKEHIMELHTLRRRENAPPHKDPMEVTKWLQPEKKDVWIH